MTNDKSKMKIGKWVYRTMVAQRLTWGSFSSSGHFLPPPSVLLPSVERRGRRYNFLML
jgi:hypothetical protein